MSQLACTTDNNSLERYEEEKFPKWAEYLPTLSENDISLASPVLYVEHLELDVSEKGLYNSEKMDTNRRWIEEEKYQPKTKLGQRLWELRKKIISGGAKLLNEEELEREVQERKGGIRE